jgi:hypothetical protein
MAAAVQGDVDGITQGLHGVIPKMGGTQLAATVLFFGKGLIEKSWIFPRRTGGQPPDPRDFFQAWRRCSMIFRTRRRVAEH